MKQIQIVINNKYWTGTQPKTFYCKAIDFNKKTVKFQYWPENEIMKIVKFFNPTCYKSMTISDFGKYGKSLEIPLKFLDNIYVY